MAESAVMKKKNNNSQKYDGGDPLGIIKDMAVAMFPEIIIINLNH